MMEPRRVVIASDDRVECLDLVCRWLTLYPNDIVLHVDAANRWLSDDRRTANYCTAPVESDLAAEFVELLNRFDPSAVMMCSHVDEWSPNSATLISERLARQRGACDLVGERVVGDCCCCGFVLRRDDMGDGVGAPAGGSQDCVVVLRQDMERWTSKDSQGVVGMSGQERMDRMMLVKVRGEFGYDLALEGLSFNFDQSLERMPAAALRLAPKDHGHNKFLRSVFLWVEVRAPRYWWAEADTFQVATTKQSQSTMHTIRRRPLTQADFCDDILDSYLAYLNELIVCGACVRGIKKALPESFLQKRMWVFNYQTLREIIIQRETHQLVEWQIFCRSMLEQVQHPELLPGDPVKMNERINSFFGSDCAS